MFDTATARRMMVDGQVRIADVTDLALLDAMAQLPREQFVPAAVAGLAYLDNDIPIAKGRALIKPMVLAKLIQAARVGHGDRVLDVACGTGYSSAVLGRLAGAVIGLEEDVELAARAKTALAAVGAAGVEVVVGPLTAGWPGGGPYDVILFDGATEVVPQAFAPQLKPAGRLVCIFGRSATGKAMIYRLSEGRLVGRPIFDAAAPLLPGFAAAPAFVF